ncbi:MAG TPA: DUF6510 family protein [Actinomycetes bacterium]|nr:DUF6510 family protein [Actinomycetes bacterium]
MDERELLLDGNAAAGLLGEVFTVEMTLARTTCGGCGAVRALGALDAYMHAPGVVLRCPGCQQVLVRAARAGDRLLLDLQGVRVLGIDLPG